MRALIAGALACLGLATLAPVAGAVPGSAGQAGWFWGNPLPQGNTLTAVDFIGSRGYAAGELGTLLRTDDAGATWTGVSTGLTAALVRVQMIDADTVIVGGGCALRRSNDGGQSFTRLPWTASDENCSSEIASFHFPTASVGYVVTKDGGLYWTTDGGQSFSRQTSLPVSISGRSNPPTDIYFLDATTGVATAGFARRVFRTVDSGSSWVEVANIGTDPMQAIAFPTATDGYAVGGSTMLRTVDGGVSWSRQPLGGAPYLGYDGFTSIACGDATTCLIGGPDGLGVRTTDGGATGALITASSKQLLALAFASASRAVAVGEGGSIVASDDAGQTWAPVNGSVAGSDFRRLRATSDRIANIGGANGMLARTLDGGQSWTSVDVPTGETVVDSSFPSREIGYAIASHGLFKTTNGGASWLILDSGVKAGLVAVLAIDPQTVVLIGPDGVRLSRNGGASFEVVRDRDVRDLRLINIQSAGAALLAYAGKALRVSSDDGQSWRRIPRPPGTKGMLDADFVSATVGFALTRDSRLWQTQNGGRSWKEVFGAGTELASGISFSSATDGYLTADDFSGLRAGYAFHTTDGGKSFAPQLVSIGRLFELVDTGSTAYAAMPGGSFFATTTGGQAGNLSTLTLDQKAASASSKRRIEIEGTLKPAEGGERILVSYHVSGDWLSRTEVVGSDGTFTSRFKVVAATPVIAQWLGDDTRAGAGSKVVWLKPPRRPEG